MTNATHMNIDFLHGLGVSPDGISPAGSSGVENSGPLFGEMLNEMLMSYPGAINRQAVNGEASDVTQFAKPSTKQFSLLSNPEAGTPGEQAVPIDKSIISSESIVKQIVPNVPTTIGAQTVVDDNIRAFNNEIRAQLPTEALPMTNTAIKMNLAVPTELHAGSYEVIESSHANGTIQLKLVDPSARESSIQVSLPADLLSQNPSGSNTKQSSSQTSVTRVDLDAIPKQATNVERLFAQLNLKQIEISEIDKSAVFKNSTSDQLAIKLSGTKDGVDVQLKAEVPLDQLNARKVESQLSPITKFVEQKQQAAISEKFTNNASIQNSDTVQSATTNRNSVIEQPLTSRQESGIEAKQATTVSLFAPALAPKIRNVGTQLRSNRVNTNGDVRSSVPSTPQAATTVENEQLLTMFSQSLKEGQSAANKIVNNVARKTTSNFEFSTFGSDLDKADPFANLNSIRETGKTLGDKLSPRDVRFSLPDDLASKMKPNGQSVMIRIEPDHLGPARLSLRMYQDKLSARITVETIGIKTVVEQSLDRLTQQLIKSGIDVERIEVALDNRQSGEHLSERHPHWQRQVRPNYFDENILSETNEVSSASPIPTVAPAYIGGGGVNVLA